MGVSDAAALDAIEAQADAIAYAADVSRHDAPATLYHYTTLAGLLGILTTGKLWFSDVRYSNDPAEAWHGRSLVEAALARRFPEPLVKHILAIFDDNSRYTASFSANGDLLQQWRAYCQNGCGASVGMTTSALVGHPSLVVGRIEYSEQRQRQRLEAVVDLYANALDWTAPRDRSELRLLAARVAVTLFVLAVHFKGSAYAIEEEYRAHYTLADKVLDDADSQLEFRASAASIVPYIPVNLIPPGGEPHASPFAEIILGPRVDADLASAALKHLLRCRGLAPVQISCSKVQMR